MGLALLGDAPNRGFWHLDPVDLDWEYGAAFHLVYDEGTGLFSYAYDELGPLCDPVLVVDPTSARQAIVDVRHGMVERVLLFEDRSKPSGLPEIIAIQCLPPEDGVAMMLEVHLEQDQANWRWRGPILVASTDGSHYAFDNGRVQPLGERIGPGGPHLFDDLRLGTFHPAVWGSEARNGELWIDPSGPHLLGSDGEPMIRVRRMRGEPSVASEGVGRPGPKTSLWDNDGSMWTSTTPVGTTEHLGTEADSSVIVRRVPVGEETVEIHTRPPANPNVAAMAASIVDSLLIFR